MYIPHYFKNTNEHDALDFIARHPFAVLISANKQIHATHIPLVLYKTESAFKLLGHFAKRNPQAKEDGISVKAIFSGPDHYVSASSYEGDDDVPTWNYQACHVDGTMTFVDDLDETKAVLDKTIEKFESKQPRRWSFKDVCESNLHAFLKQITAFTIEIHSIHFAEKLSQDKSLEDLKSVISAIERLEKHENKSMAKVLKTQLSKRARGKTRQ
ncbi:FMN-binding negative transcriptional regulator [Alteromonas oceanisediminis]|uniref:FMN-binding negative transcriptional regulator n=1 Tax=Alteromonas oceanisediminis TaxID=2836180 RepID=UPI001BDADC2B|nr:FMN-binding negative transcriptional regulator [Alteromonas oceanisediminis]MBT0585166.1 FMN-binding negative transcriptional regulator [Alteromonas oceanisediminis]